MGNLCQDGESWKGGRFGPCGDVQMVEFFEEVGRSWSSFWAVWTRSSMAHVGGDVQKLERFRSRVI